MIRCNLARAAPALAAVLLLLAERVRRRRQPSDHTHDRRGHHHDDADHGPAPRPRARRSQHHHDGGGRRPAHRGGLRRWSGGRRRPAATVQVGEKVRLRVESDVADEVHVHTYDLRADVGPGQPADHRVRDLHPRPPRGRAGEEAQAAAGAGGAMTPSSPSWPTGIGGRTDLPLPAWMFRYGAAAAVLVSFAALALFWPDGPPRGRGRWPCRWASPGRRRACLAVVARALGLAVFVASCWRRPPSATTQASRNLAPVVVYVTFWVGLAFVSGFVGRRVAGAQPVRHPGRRSAQRLRRTPRRSGRRRRQPTGPDGEADEAERGDEAGGATTPRPMTRRSGLLAGRRWGCWRSCGSSSCTPTGPSRGSCSSSWRPTRVVMLAAAARYGPAAGCARGEAFAALFGVAGPRGPPPPRRRRAGCGSGPPFVGLAALGGGPGSRPW